MPPRTKLIEVWPRAWYLIIERQDKPAGVEFGKIAHPDYPSHYSTWTCWARAIGPFAHSHHAFVEMKHFHPYLGTFEPTIYRYARFAVDMPVIDRHVVMALVANASEPTPLPEPVKPADFDALDQIVTCDCGNLIPLDTMDEENGDTVVWCPGCRRSVTVDSILNVLAGNGVFMGVE